MLYSIHTCELCPSHYSRILLWNSPLSLLHRQFCFWFSSPLCSSEKLFLTSLLPASVPSSKELPKYVVSSFSPPSLSLALSDQGFAQTNLLGMLLSRSPVASMSLNPVTSCLLISHASHTSFLGLRCLYPANFPPRYPEWLSPTFRALFLYHLLH